MNYWFKEELREFCEYWAIAKLLISICIHRWLHLMSCEIFSKCFRKLLVFRCRNFLLLTCFGFFFFFFFFFSFTWAFGCFLETIGKHSFWRDENTAREILRELTSQVSFTQKDWIIYQDICHVIDIFYHDAWASFVGIRNFICAN